MCVETIRTGLDLSDNRFEGHMPMFTLKYESFPIYLFGNPINVC